MTTKNIMYGQYVVPPASELVKFNVGQPSPSILPLNVQPQSFASVNR